MARLSRREKLANPAIYERLFEKFHLKAEECFSSMTVGITSIARELRHGWLLFCGRECGEAAGVHGEWKYYRKSSKVVDKRLFLKHRESHKPMKESEKDFGIRHLWSKNTKS